MGMDEIKLSAVVVTFNEEKYLRDCLASLSFCDELLVVDLGSTDGSVRIAEEAGAKVLRHERVPVVEKIREYAMRLARNDWVVFLDPDEVMPPIFSDEVVKAAGAPLAAVIRVPWQFYFKGKPLTCCVWGVKNMTKPVFIHRERTSLKPLVHSGYQPLPGYVVIEIPRSGDNFIRHYWMSSYGQLFEKHLRYIRYEGESRYNSGQRFSWLSMLWDAAQAVKTNLISYRGLLGGTTGVFLSFFYGWYVFMGWLSLRSYQKKMTPEA